MLNFRFFFFCVLIREKYNLYAIGKSLQSPVCSSNISQNISSHIYSEIIQGVFSEFVSKNSFRNYARTSKGSPKKILQKYFGGLFQKSFEDSFGTCLQGFFSKTNLEILAGISLGFLSEISERIIIQKHTNNASKIPL